MTEKRKRTALDGAAAKGWDAFHEGKSSYDCPYVDKRNGRHGTKTTWSRSFITSWRCGWLDARRGEPRP